MCKSSSKTTTNSVPGYVNDLSSQLSTKAGEVLNKPYEDYSGQRVADFTSDQQQAFQGLRDLISGYAAQNPGGTAVKGATDYAAAPAQSIGTERVVDQNGKLGAISDYLNPWTDAALQPALRKIQEQSDAQRKQIASGATSAGAFGDARQGIKEALLGRDTSMAMGDTAAKAYNDAYNNAMALRTGDVNRFKDVDTQNANFNEQALGRELTGTGAALDRSTQNQNNLLTQLQAMLNTGGQQQQNQQQKLDTAYQDFMRKYIGDDATKIAAVTQALGGMKGNYDTSQTTTQPDNSILGGLGSAAGSTLGSNGFWSWLGGSTLGGGAGGGAAAAAALI